MTANERHVGRPTEEDLERVVAELRRQPRPVRSIANALGWPTLRASIALLELWHRGRADVDVREPYGWRLTR